MTTARRRSAGEGSIVGPYTTKTSISYTTKYGTTKTTNQRYAAKFRDSDGKQVLRRRDESGTPFPTREAASKYLNRTINKVNAGTWAEASQQPLGEYLDEWADGLRLASSTVASYKKNVRLHIKPALENIPLSKLTATRIDKFYRELETSGRKDHKAGEPLGLRTVSYIHTILRSALQDGVRRRLLTRNPCDDAKPPTAGQAKAQREEIHPWTPAELNAFLTWATEHVTMWRCLAMTGMRRGELVALRWRNVDLEAGSVSIRRSATVVKTKGEGEQIVEGPTKGRESRTINLDAGTVAALKSWRTKRGGLTFALIKPDALVFSAANGADYLHPERLSRTFKADVAKCDGPPIIRLHDLRHTHATILLQARTPVHVVSKRLGHASAAITLNVYAHVMPGDQAEAANDFAAAVDGA